MGQLQTFQGGYEKMRATDVGADEAALATTAIPSSARPSTAKELPPECNSVEILPYLSDFTADVDGTFELYGWAVNGPAEFLCEISCTAGTAQRTTGVDGTSAFCDKLVCTTQGHIKTVSVTDVGSTNNVAKINIDMAGLRYIDARFTDVSESWNALIRYY